MNIGIYTEDMEATNSKTTWTEDESNDPMLLVIDSARWAQNAHNIQSWKLRRQADDSYHIYLDEERLLPETDPVHRQLVISIGSFVGAAEIAAKELGYKLDYQYLPEGDFDEEAPGAYPLANISLSDMDKDNNNVDTLMSTDGITIDALSTATVKYKTLPMEYTQEWYTEQEKKWSDGSIIFEWIDNQDQVDQLSALAVEAFKIEMELPPTRDESIDYTQIGNDARERHPYGITLLGNFDKSNWWFIETISTLFPQTPDQYTDTSIKMFNQTLENEHVMLMVRSVGNTRELQLETGRRLQLAWMEVLIKGGRLLPLSQGIQEYPEVEDIYKNLHNHWAKDGETIQMWLSLGKPDGEFYQSPRLQTMDIID